jgi:hypothetical protein
MAIVCRTVLHRNFKASPSRAYNRRMGRPEVVLLIALVMLLIGVRHIAALGEALQEFVNQLGGGPQPPTHPLPGNDSKILNRTRSRN